MPQARQGALHVLLQQVRLRQHAHALAAAELSEPAEAASICWHLDAAAELAEVLAVHFHTEAAATTPTVVLLLLLLLLLC